MLGVGLVAVLFAGLGVWEAIAVMSMTLIALTPVLLAPPGRRLTVSTWVASFYPVMTLFFLYATWMIAWGVLGHRPRSSLDDPKYISPLLVEPYIVTLYSLTTLLVSPLACVLLAITPVGHRGSRILPVLLSPLVWLLVIVIVIWDPLRVFEWFMD